MTDESERTSSPPGPVEAPIRIESPAVGIDTSEQRRRRITIGAGAGVLVLVAALGSMVTSNSEWGACAAPCLVPMLSALLGATGALGARQRPSVLGPGTVTIEDGTLTITGGRTGARSIPLADVTQGFWEAPDRVRLVLRSWEAVVVTVSREDGDRVLRAAGVSVAERVLRVPLASVASRVPGSATLAGVVLGILIMATFTGLSLWIQAARAVLDHGSILNLGEQGFFAGASLVATTLFVALVRRREAVVGTDGVIFRGALWSRFVPYTTVAGVEACHEGVRLDKKDESSLVLPTGSVDRPAGAMYRDAILLRIREALAAGSRAALSTVDLERIERRGRTFDAWREDLGKLLLSAGDYRRRGMSSADLGAVIEDTTAPFDRRVGAAVALGATQREEARRRVRIAAQACADDALRRALERAAEGEIEAAVVEREERRAVRGA